MSIMAKYARIYSAEPNDADVGARNRSVVTLREQFGGLKPRQAIDVAATLVDALGGADLPPTLADSVEKAISHESAAFVLHGSEQQGAVCAMVAAFELVRNAPLDTIGWTAADAMAAALWSALALQDPFDSERLEELRNDILGACRDRVDEIANVARTRVDVPDVGTLTIPEENVAGPKAQTAYRRATAPVIKALRENANLDREEIDFLWWALAEHSKVLDCPLVSKNTMTRAIASGIEAAWRLRRLPSDGHRHVALRLVGDTRLFTLDEVVDELGADRAALGRRFAGSWVAQMPTVFPLLAALAGERAITPPTAKLDARGWGARAILEAGIHQLEDHATGSR